MYVTYDPSAETDNVNVQFTRTPITSSLNIPNSLWMKICCDFCPSMASIWSKARLSKVSRTLFVPTCTSNGVVIKTPRNKSLGAKRRPLARYILQHRLMSTKRSTHVFKESKKTGSLIKVILHASMTSSQAMVRWRNLVALKTSNLHIIGPDNERNWSSH